MAVCWRQQLLAASEWNVGNSILEYCGIEKLR
jgi:hypothetical protein